MLKFYYNTGPNPMKVALFLEEAGLEYEPIPVDGRKGDQFKPEYLAINPNAKAPSLVDGDVAVFDSNAILLYLGEKTGKFMPAGDPKSRGQLLSWLMFVATGLGPYSGQAVHFKRMAPEKVPYAINRYDFEAERHYKILDDQLAKHREDPACASCHNLMDPVGFALENYDAIGRWHAEADSRGGFADGSEFDGIAGLEDALLKRPELFVTALTEKLLTYALGRGLAPHDAPAVRKIVSHAKANGWKFSEGIAGIVTSVPFTMRSSE